MSQAPDDRTIAAVMRRLLDARGAGKTICPSEVARELVADERRGASAWRDLMPRVRAVAAECVRAGEMTVTQRGEPVAIDHARGPVRIGYA